MDKKKQNFIFWMPRIQDFKVQNFIQWAMAGFAIFISLIDFLAFSGMGYWYRVIKARKSYGVRV
jgi:hypothetical protein